MTTVVGVPKEIKNLEGRVAMQPDGVSELVHHGHGVVVQAGAGVGAGFTDSEYEEAGARLVGSADEVFEVAGLIVKPKSLCPRSTTATGRVRSSSPICTWRRTRGSRRAQYLARGPRLRARSQGPRPAVRLSGAGAELHLRHLCDEAFDIARGG